MKSLVNQRYSNRVRNARLVHRRCDWVARKPIGGQMANWLCETETVRDSILYNATRVHTLRQRRRRRFLHRFQRGRLCGGPTSFARRGPRFQRKHFRLHRRILTKDDGADVTGHTVQPTRSRGTTPHATVHTSYGTAQRRTPPTYLPHQMRARTRVALATRHLTLQRWM